MNSLIKSSMTVLGAVALTIVGTSTASAATPTSLTCTGGTIPSGTYNNVAVSGQCQVPDHAVVTIQGNLAIAAGANFDAQTNSTVTIKGNVTAASGSKFGLGCTEAHPCENEQPASGSTHDTVAGDVILNRVFNAAINGSHIKGSLISTGGGAASDRFGFIPFSVKDDTIDGNVSITGLNTVWFGIIRSTIGGNVTVTNDVMSDPDANEIVSNTIGGNLSCRGNSPAPQLGDAVEGAPPGYGLNKVGGRATGQCASLV